MTEPNEIDEFAGIEPAPPQRSPILALVIIGLCAGTIFHLRSEIAYAVSSRQAAPLEELRGANLPFVDRYVRVHGIPDRRNSLYVEAKGQKTRESFFRLLDAEPPIFVRAHDTSLRKDLTASWQGRLRRFGDVAYAASLRDYFGRAAQTKRYLDLASYKSGSLRDRAGRDVTLPTGIELEVELVPTEYSLELPRERFPKQEDAQHEIERVLRPLGLAIHPLEPSPDSFRFGTPMLESDPPRRNALFAAIEIGEIDIAPEVPVLTAPRASAHVDGDALQLGDKKLPWSTVATIAWREPLHIDDDALVLTEGESPADFLYAPIVALVLLVLAAWNVWYLLRPRRSV